MATLFFINVIAATFAISGLLLAFRPRAVRRWVAGRAARPDAPPGDVAAQSGVDSVLRMVGVMIAAFSITGCAFANLIAYFTAHSPN